LRKKRFADCQVLLLFLPLLLLLLQGQMVRETHRLERLTKNSFEWLISFLSGHCPAT